MEAAITTRTIFRIPLKALGIPGGMGVGVGVSVGVGVGNKANLICSSSVLKVLKIHDKFNAIWTAISQIMISAVKKWSHLQNGEFVLSIPGEGRMLPEIINPEKMIVVNPVKIRIMRANLSLCPFAFSLKKFMIMHEIHFQCKRICAISTIPIETPSHS